MKLLIVDDEQLEREGLEAIIRSGFPELTILQAKNGAKAIQAVHRELPDLVLMDIKMPGMNGLEAVEKIASSYPAIKFIMVTAYDTFDFARKALKLGVVDYLLKPSKASEIIETVGKVMKRIENETSELRERKQERETLQRMMPVVEADVVTQLLYDHVHEVHLDEMLGMLGGDTTKEVYAMLIVLGKTAAHDVFYGALKAKMRELKNGWVGAMSGNQIPLIVFRENGTSYRSQASSFVQQIFMLQAKTAGTVIFVGIGNPYESLSHIRQSYQEALITSADTSPPSKYRFYADFPALIDRRSKYPEKQLEKQFLEQIRLSRWDQVRESVMELIQYYEKMGAGIMEAQQRGMEALWIVSRAILELGIETEKPLLSFQSQDFRQLQSELEGLLDKQFAAIEAHQMRLEPDVVQRIKQYIVSHSQEDISLETISREVSLSPFYISKVFKEQLGINYIDFLTECRIQKAKSLMGNPGLSLKEISYEVGYNDPNYFSKVFKRSCGVAPTDYRKTMLSKKI